MRPSLSGLGPVRWGLLAAGQIDQRAPEIARANTGFVDRIDKVFDRVIWRSSAQPHENPDRNLSLFVGLKVIEQPAQLNLAVLTHLQIPARSP